MTKMAAMPIYGKISSKIFSGTGGDDPGNDDPGVTLTFFGKVNFGNLGFIQEKVKTGNFSETIAASDLKGSRSRHLIGYMKICEY